MRILAFILAFTVSFLATKPGLDAMFSCHDMEVSCCKESCDPYSVQDDTQKENEENDCNGNNCNPFMSCGVNSLMTITSIGDSQFVYEFTEKGKCSTVEKKLCAR